MDYGLPLPAQRRFHRQTRIIEPPLVEKLARTIGQATPCECRDLIDHFPELIWRVFFHFLDRPSDSAASNLYLFIVSNSPRKDTVGVRFAMLLGTHRPLVHRCPTLKSDRSKRGRPFGELLARDFSCVVVYAPSGRPAAAPPFLRLHSSSAAIVRSREISASVTGFPRMDETAGLRASLTQSSLHTCQRRYGLATAAR